jgi:hypothetical protein
MLLIPLDAFMAWTLKTVLHNTHKRLHVINVKGESDMDLAQDKGTCRALVIAVMKLGVP